MAKVQAFPVGLVAPTGPPAIFCYIEVAGTGWYLRELVESHTYEIVTKPRATEFSRVRAEGLFSNKKFGELPVRFETSRICPPQL